jgi:ubiquinone/menaquinone biosynthesis C-methylase UbiE
MKTLLKKALGIPADVSFRQELRQVLRASVNALIASAGNTPRYTPYPAKQGRYLLQHFNHDNHRHLAASLPVPPPGVRFGYGDTEEYWLSGGKKDIDTMMMLLTSTNFSIQKGSRILDLGCASGRMIRWLAGLAEECEIWGVDIDARLIVWCQESLTPPFNFATVTTMPHLPFEDRYFDLIYCGSVFTHIDDLADAWLLEIKRIIRPGGRVFITVQDKHSADLIINDPSYYSQFRSLLLRHDKDRNLRNGNFYKCSVLPGDENCQVFYDVEYLRQHWGRVLKIISFTPEAYSGGLCFQTAVLMEKSDLINVAPRP